MGTGAQLTVLFHDLDPQSSGEACSRFVFDRDREALESRVEALQGR